MGLCQYRSQCSGGNDYSASNTDPVSRVKEIIRGFVGLLLAGYLIRLVVESNGVDIAQAWQSANISYIVASFLFLVAGTPLVVHRWAMLLEVQEISLSYWNILRLTMIGIFFNMVAPGGVGGDLLKMVYLRKQAGERTPEGLLTIVVDRVIGLSGLLVVALVSILFSSELIVDGPPSLKAAVGVVGLGALGGLACAIGLFASPWLESLVWVRSAVGLLTTRLPDRVVQTFRRLLTAFFLYRHSPKVLLYSLSLSVVVHSLMAGGVACLGLAFGVTKLRVTDYFLATMVANVVAAIPLTPGGLGGRDFVLSLFFNASGAKGAEAGLIPTTLSFLLVLWSLVGGLFFVFDRGVPAQKESSGLNHASSI